MAERKIYYFKMKLYSRDGKTEYDIADFKDVFKTMIDTPAISKARDGVHIIDLTSISEQLHTTMDVIRYKNDYAFLRTSRQKPTASMITRSYDTGVPSAVLPGVSENEKGIEKYTYIHIDYRYGILSILGSQGAPDQGVLIYFFDRYSENYSIELEAIPNPNGIEKIYDKEKMEISEVNIAIPVPDPALLQEVLGHGGRRFFEEVSRESLKVSIRLSSTIKRGKITNNSDDSETLLDCIKDNLGDYTVANVKASYEGCRTQTYNFYDENFFYPINISSFHIMDGKRIYYTESEYMTLCNEAMRSAYNEIKEYVVVAANRAERD